MSNKLQTVEQVAVRLLGEIEQHTTLCVDDYERNIFLQGVNAGYNEANQAAQGYMDALERIIHIIKDETLDISQTIDFAEETAQQALSAAPTTQEECCGRCVGHCYLDNEGESIELTSLVPRDTNVLDELEKWVNENWFGANEDDMTYHENVIDANKLLTKIQQLKPRP